MVGEHSLVSKRRSKTGCLTCRQRKVRCDEHHPVCKACDRLNLSCSYPHAGISGSPSQRIQQRQPNGQRSPANASAESPDHGRSRAIQLNSRVGDVPGAHEFEHSWDANQHNLPHPLNWSPSSQRLLDVSWLDHLSFDPDYLFDDYGLLPSDIQARTPIAPPSPPTTIACRDVTIEARDREVLQHFTSTMDRFCHLRNTTNDNLYNHILMNYGLFHSTLFDAMLSWSSLHLARTQKKSRNDARQRYDRAYAALIEDMGHDVAPSLLLTTIWFLLQYQLNLAEGVEGFCELLNMAAEVARSELLDKDESTAINRLGPIGSLVLVWMSARDSQSGYIGLGGRLLGCLRSCPYVYELVDASSVSANVDNISQGAQARTKGTAPRPRSHELQKCMKLSFKNVTVAGQIKLLGRIQAQRIGSSAWTTIRANLGVLRAEIEQEDSSAARAAFSVAKRDLTAMLEVDQIHYNRLLLLAEYYVSLIQYHAYVPPSAYGTDLPSPGECADRIIRMCQRVQSVRPNSPQGVWPTHIFVAGITTSDPIYQSWAVHALEEAECWGAHIAKTRQLLQAMIKRQNLTGHKANLIEVMKETTGLFIV